MPTTLPTPLALKPGTRVAPASKRPAVPPQRKPAGTGPGAGLLWALWLGAVGLMLTAALLR